MARRRRRTRTTTPSLPVRLAKTLGWILFVLVLTPVVLTFAFKIVPPPVTPLMLIRLVQGYPLHKSWVPLNQMPAILPKVAMAGEDNLFCQHAGFDWKAVNKAYARWQNDQPHGGASTISMQTAKNVFLWPGQTLFRKALEVPTTLLIEAIWGKRRIMEVYLNVAEFGPGIYGVEAAARYHFKTHARNLTARQAALLAAVLPSPLRWSAGHPGPYVAQRAGILLARVPKLGPLTACVAPPRH